MSRVEGGGGRGERLLKREGDEDDLEVSVNGRLFDVFDDIFDIFIELEGVFDKHNTVCSVNSVNSVNNENEKKLNKIKNNRMKPEYFLDVQELSTIENETIVGGSQDTMKYGNRCKNKVCPHKDREQ